MQANKILELCQDIIGRRKIKVVLHEIYPDSTRWNSNGITYLEQYTRDNADSVKGMPLCAEFLDDDKEIPYGHGLTAMQWNIPVFEDSVQVGAFEDWTIEDIELDGTTHRCLCGIGYINESRYPNFCKWLDEQVAESKRVFGSIEFTGTPENDGEIIYDGGWKEEGRIPMIYDYSGFCIISIKPADEMAMLLEYEGAKENPESNEFDSVFVEKNTASTEYDDIFLATIGMTSNDEEIENDNFEDVFE